MPAGHPITLLMFGTLGIVAILIVVLSLRFRKRENRHPMEGNCERNIDEIRRDGPADS